MKEQSDADILGLLRSEKHRERGFRMLVEKYQERLYWHVRRLVTDHDDADDVIQNTFVKAFKGMKGFKGKSRLYTWLFRIATNEALSFIQARKRRNAIPLDDENLGIAQMLAADNFFDGDRIQAQLAAAMETLPDKQKAVFSLRYYDEMSYREMSQVFGTTVGALKASYHHAVKKIEAFFNEAQV